MTYSLMNDDGKTLNNPTEADIRVAVAKIDGDKFVMAQLFKGKDCLQANWEEKNQLSFQCEEGGKPFHTKAYPADVVVKVFLSYMTGTDDWKKMVELKPGYS